MTHKRICLHGPSGEFDLDAPVPNPPHPLIEYKDRFYAFAGTQDGFVHYRERTPQEHIDAVAH